MFNTQNDTPDHNEESHAKIHVHDSSVPKLLEIARQKLESEPLPPPSDFLRNNLKDFDDAPPTYDYIPEPPAYFDELPLVGEQIPHEVRNKPKPPAPKFSFDQFSITDNLEAMKTKMLNDVFVLDGVALLGQLTAIYAKPNTGKTLLTLWMLTESIKAGRIKGENVYYINADDTYKGLVTKGEVAKKYGIRMIAPNENGFKVENFSSYLRQLIDDDSAKDVIIVLDTLKKFTDLMDKKKGSEFMKTAREFTLKGGTMIMLAHTNKNRNLNGKVVAGGTSDIGDDCDCAYTLDEVQGNSKTHKEVLFENFKSRGNVKKELLATYAQSDNPAISNYYDLFNSVQIANSGDIEQIKKERDAAIKQDKDKEAIEAITDAINQGNHKKPEIVSYSMKAWGVSRAKTKKALDDYTGTKLSNSSLWRVQIGERNSQIYYLLSNENISADDYENAKNG